MCIREYKFATCMLHNIVCSLALCFLFLVAVGTGGGEAGTSGGESGTGGGEFGGRESGTGGGEFGDGESDVAGSHQHGVNFSSLRSSSISSSVPIHVYTYTFWQTKSGPCYIPGNDMLYNYALSSSV